MSVLSNPLQRLKRKLDPAAVPVLVVEDHDASRRLVMELLRASGFGNLYFARDAEAAIGLIAAHPPDLMIVDWNLPGMTGLELVESMRCAALTGDARFPNPQAPIVMLTARQRARDVDQARLAGVDEFVIKPFSTASLLRAVANALNRRRRFITSDAYVGPDRRRRKAAAFPGLGRRAEDVAADLAASAESGLRARATDEVRQLRARLHAPGGGVDRKTVNTAVTRLIAGQTAAHDLRMRLIERAAASLNQYVSLFGAGAEAEVLDVHFDALIQLGDMPPDAHDEALDIVEHLDALVTRRETQRRVQKRARS
jgi:CheY-like chemotaxis protein